jgi:hypothetical protein
VIIKKQNLKFKKDESIFRTVKKKNTTTSQRKY